MKQNITTKRYMQQDCKKFKMDPGSWAGVTNDNAKGCKFKFQG